MAALPQDVLGSHLCTVKYTPLKLANNLNMTTSLVKGLSSREKSSIFKAITKQIPTECRDYIKNWIALNDKRICSLDDCNEDLWVLSEGKILILKLFIHSFSG
jgi:hypothetical protein